MGRRVLDIFFLLILIAVSVYGGYLYYERQPCRNPIMYSLGNFDKRFGITQESFLQAIREAEVTWESPINKDLFVYDEEGDLKINLIYDERQQVVEAGKKLVQTVGETKKTTDAIKQEFESIRERYEKAKGEYELLLAEFQAVQKRYSDQVKYWNSRGGAPKHEYEKLTQEKNDLLALQTTLQQKQTQVNTLAGQINALVGQYNYLIQHTNVSINTYNQNDLVGEEFNEGEYVSDGRGTEMIHIYSFADRAQLVRVLAHELGHALGLAHNENPESIMYRLNQSKNETLTAEDATALRTLCGI